MQVIQQIEILKKSATISNIFVASFYNIIFASTCTTSGVWGLTDWLWVSTHPCLEFMSVLTHNYCSCLQFITSNAFYILVCSAWNGSNLKKTFFFSLGDQKNRTPTKIVLWKKRLKVAIGTFFLKSPYLDNMVSMQKYSRILKHFYFPLVDRLWPMCTTHHKTGKTEPSSSRYCVFGWRTNSWRILKYFRTMIDRVQSMESSAAKTPGSGDIPLQNPYSKHYICSILPLK
jgi:hypothetical protein